MKKRTKEEKTHLALVASLGCIVCGQPPQIHHPRSFKGLGMGKKTSDWLAIPLCKMHHNEIHQRMAVGKDDEHVLLAKTIESIMWSR